MKLTCYGAYIKGEEFWFPSKEINALYYMNIADGKTKYVGMFQNCLNDTAWKIRKVIEYNNELYFFSKSAYQVWKLNKVTGRMDEYTYNTQPVGQITNVEIVHKEAWVIPGSFDSPIICFDLQKKVGYQLQWDNETYSAWGTSSFTRVARTEDCLYFATRNKDDIHLCILDCSQKKISFREIDTLCRINCIGIKDNQLAVVGENKRRQGVLQIYDLHSMQILEENGLSLAESLTEKSDIKYVSLFFATNNIILVPAWAEKVISYNLDTKTEKYIEFPDEFCSILGSEKAIRFYETIECGRKVYLMPYQISQILELDLEELCFNAWNVEVGKEEFLKSFHNSDTSESMRINESKNLTLSVLCTIMADANSHKHNKVKDNRGSSIYRSLQSVHRR